MRARRRLRQRSAVLGEYRRCQEIVWRELDEEPMQEMTELYQVTLEGHFSAEYI